MRTPMPWIFGLLIALMLTVIPFSRSQPNRLSTAAKPSALVRLGTVTSRRAPGPARRASCAMLSAEYGVSQVIRSRVHAWLPGAAVTRVRTTEGRR